MKILTIFAISLLFTKDLCGQMRTSKTGNNYVVEDTHIYNFNFNGIETTQLVGIGNNYVDKLNYYHKLNHDENGSYRRFIKNDPYRDLIFSEVSNTIRLTCLANNYNLIDYTFAFVQSIPHFDEMDGYQQYPSELLINGTGDCNDKSVLFAAFLDSYDYKNIFIHYPGHVNVGLWSDRDGCYLNHNDKRYVICETNSFSKIGVFWDCGVTPTRIEE